MPSTNEQIYITGWKIRETVSFTIHATFESWNVHRGGRINIPPDGNETGMEKFDKFVNICRNCRSELKLEAFVLRDTWGILFESRNLTIIVYSVGKSRKVFFRKENFVENCLDWKVIDVGSIRRIPGYPRQKTSIASKQQPRDYGNATSGKSKRLSRENSCEVLCLEANRPLNNYTIRNCLYITIYT